MGPWMAATVGKSPEEGIAAGEDVLYVFCEIKATGSI